MHKYVGLRTIQQRMLQRMDTFCSLGRVRCALKEMMEKDQCPNPAPIKPKGRWKVADNREWIEALHMKILERSNR